MSGSFQDATREQNLLRMALEGMPGAGKTWTSLVFAQRLAEHYGGRVAVIDAEHGRSRRYAGMRPSRDAAPLSFALSTLTDFSPSNYTAKIEEAGRAGFTVLVIDSFSHEWAGRGGVLALKDAQPAKKAYTGWAEVNPLHDRVIDAILGSPCHVICTMRAKVKHIIGEDNKPQKVGVGAVQRPGTEYEFEIYGMLDRSHILTISKSMCPAIDNAIVPCPTGAFMDTVIQWLETGEAPRLEMTRRLLSDDQMRVLIGLVNETNYNMEKLKAEILRRHRVQEIADLRPDQAEQEIARLRALAASHKVRGASAGASPTTADAVATAPKSTANGHASECSQALPASTGTTPASPELATDAQLHRLVGLRGELAAHGMTAEAWKAILARRNVDTARKLTVAQADELIASLSHRVATMQLEQGMLAPEAEGESPATENAAPPGAAEKSDSPAPPAAAGPG